MPVALQDEVLKMSPGPLHSASPVLSVSGKQIIQSFCGLLQSSQTVHVMALLHREERLCGRKARPTAW